MKKRIEYHTTNIYAKSSNDAVTRLQDCWTNVKVVGAKRNKESGIANLFSVKWKWRGLR